MIDHDEYKEVLEALESGFIEIIDIEQHRKATCEALEKQIPKKPNNIYCPICKRPLRKAKEDIGYTGKVKKRKADNYCPGCGQALDWSSENE